MLVAIKYIKISIEYAHINKRKSNHVTTKKYSTNSTQRKIVREGRRYKTYRKQLTK